MVAAVTSTLKSKADMLDPLFKITAVVCLKSENHPLGINLRSLINFPQTKQATWMTSEEFQFNKKEVQLL